MPEMFNDILFDFMASTGASSTRETSEKEQQYIQNTIGFGGLKGLTNLRSGYSWLDPVPTQQQMYNESQFFAGKEAYYDIGALQGSKMMQVGRDAGFNARLSAIADESAAYHTDVDNLLSGLEQQGEKFLQGQTQLEGLKAQARGSGGSASSVGAYSQLAKSEMQNTNRLLQNINALKAPAVQEVDLFFTDPVTGKSMSINDEFDPDMASADNIADSVRTTLEKKYTARTDEIFSQLSADNAKMSGFTYEELRENRDEFTAMAESLAWQEEYMFRGIHNEDQLAQHDSQYDNRLFGDSGYTHRQVKDIREGLNNLNSAEQFASSRSMAELVGLQEGFSTHHQWNPHQKNYLTGSQIYMDLDTGKAMDALVNRTVDRFEIQNIRDVSALENEFNARKETARRVSTEQMRRNDLNKMRTQALTDEKAKYTKMLQEQQKEYASTISSFGASDSKGSTITFTDTRPA